MVFHDPLATYVPEKTQKRLRRRQRKMPGDKRSTPNVPADFLAEGLENVRAWRDRCVQTVRCGTWRETPANCGEVYHDFSSWVRPAAWRPLKRHLPRPCLQLAAKCNSPGSAAQRRRGQQLLVALCPKAPQVSSSKQRQVPGAYCALQTLAPLPAARPHAVLLSTSLGAPRSSATLHTADPAPLPAARPHTGP